MIQLTCANCRNQLEVDDAFAGSVCRCQHCGTIQTVPRKGQTSGRPRAPGGGEGSESHAGEEPKALYQVKSRAERASRPSGLEELAEIVHSSGLGSGLLNRSSPNLNLAKQKQKKQSQKTMLIAISAAIGLIVITALLMYLIMGGGKNNQADEKSVVKNGNAVQPTPEFAGLQLSGDKIIYVIDRGDATAEYFNAIKSVLLKSAKSLGPDRRFAVLLWNNGEDDSFPSTGTVFAKSDEFTKLSTWLDNVSTGRATSIDSALNNALYQTPKEIVVLTAKGEQLEDEFFNKVERIKSNKSVTIHCISINADCEPMKKIAKNSGGKYIKMSGAELVAMGEN